MAKGQLGGALRDVQMLFEAGTAGGLTDGQLLEEFRGRGGEAGQRAFAALVERHGPAVLRTCRSILRDEHAAEDAFQAVFLVLARKAGSLRVRRLAGPLAAPGRLPGRRGVRGRPRPGGGATSGGPPSWPIRRPATRTADDLGPLIHEEIDRLPGRYRAPIVLCFLEGLTREQAAGQLRWPLGTLQSRLARGRRTAARAADPPGRDALGGPARRDAPGGDGAGGRAGRAGGRDDPGRDWHPRRGGWRSSDRSPPRPRSPRRS